MGMAMGTGTQVLLGIDKDTGNGSETGAGIDKWKCRGSHNL